MEATMLSSFRQPSRFFARTATMAVCIAIAAFCGFIAMHWLQVNEAKLTDARYEFIAHHGLRKLMDGFNSRLLGMITFSKLVSYYHPDRAVWPNVVIPGYYDTAPEIRKLTLLDNIGFLPLVRPEKLSDFEQFMYDYFNSDPSIPSEAGRHNFGQGVFSIDPSLPNASYHDTTGKARLFNSSNDVIVPVLQLLPSKDSTEEMFTLNIHSNPKYGPALDKIMDECSPKYRYAEAVRRCGWISDLEPLPLPTADDPEPETDNFRSVVLQPVYLNQNTSQLVGIVGGGVNWQIMLNDSFMEYNNLECVVSDGAASFTYRIEPHGVQYIGTGDLHDNRSERYKRTISMSANTAPESGTVPYTVHIYPSREFLEADRTSTPALVGCCLTLIVTLVAVIGLMTDICQNRETLRRNKETELDNKRRFVRFVSHEIRTPLNSVHLGLELLTAELSGMVSLLTKPQSSPLAALLPGSNATSARSALLKTTQEMLASWQELAGDLKHNSECAVDVLNDLLNYDKIETGTLRLDYSAVRIYPLVEKVAKTFQMQARQKEINLKIIGLNANSDLEQDPDRYRNVVVIGDHSRLAQILRNLLSNALKFTPAGGNITVTVDWDPTATTTPSTPPAVPDEHRDLLELPRAGSVQVRVTDSGVGLSPEQLSQICSEGVQFNANQLQAGKGSGLGLFISKGLATQHGGSLSAASPGLGKGSTFALELPAWSTPAQPQQSQARLPSGMRKVESHEGGQLNRMPSLRALDMSHQQLDAPKVLVVDDAESNRKILIRLLKTRGCECKQAENGQSGIDLYQALQAKGETVDVIVMDYEMPVMDGPTATKKLRELGCTCLIVGVTGNLLPEDVDHFKRQGANAVLGKPLDITAFEEMLRKPPPWCIAEPATLIKTASVLAH